jgi:hypothetical protein
MSKLGFVFSIIVVALAAVIPVAISADRGSTTGSPIQFMATGTPAPVMATGTSTPTASDSSIVCVDTSKADKAAADYRAILDRLGSGKEPDHQAMQAFRAELLDFVDTLGELSDELPARDLRLKANYSVQAERKRIEAFTDEQLDLLHKALPNFKVVKAGVESAKSAVLDAKMGVNAKNAAGERSPNSFPIIPTPTPVTTPPPGIEHTEAAQQQINQETGDLFTPDPITIVGCPAEGYPDNLGFGMMVAIDALKTGGLIADTLCKEKTVTCPGVDAQDPIQCLVAAGINDLTSITEDINAGFDYCNGLLQSNLIQSTYEDTKVIHADLADHDQGLTSRFNSIDLFLFDLRNLNLRLNIEANLASPEDNPNAVLALPRTSCVSPELEALTDPTSSDYDPFAPEVIAGCGLLEVVSDTAKSAIDMVTEASGPASVHDAQAEFAAAVQHYNNREWKLAYARFRKAYREVVRP